MYVRMCVDMYSHTHTEEVFRYYYYIIIAVRVSCDIFNGQPYCENHYYVAKNQVCETSKKPIKKSCVSAMGKKFHPAGAFHLYILSEGVEQEHF